MSAAASTSVEEGIFRIARDMFTEPELFDLEMELIFEKNWIYACHESELARPHDFVTLRAGRQPLIVTRDGNGQLHALVNACQHRGATWCGSARATSRPSPVRSMPGATRTTAGW